MPKINCAFCGKEKQVYPYQIKKSKTGLLFCNNKCQAHYYNPPKEVKKCKICGQEKHPKNGICEAQFLRSPVNLQKMGFDVSKIGTKDVFNEYNKLKDKIENLYFNEEKSTLDLMKMFNIPSTLTMHLLFKFLGLKRRELTKSQFLSYKNGKQPIKAFSDKIHYKHGFHTSWEGKELFYRSSYELDYMKALDEAQVSYEGENYLRFEYYDTQMQKMRIAVPDFYLPESNTIVEIKSNYTYDPQNMIDKVKAYKEAGYNFKLILEHKETDI